MTNVVRRPRQRSNRVQLIFNRYDRRSFFFNAFTVSDDGGSSDGQSAILVLSDLCLVLVSRAVLLKAVTLLQHGVVRLLLAVQRDFLLLRKAGTRCRRLVVVVHPTRVTGTRFDHVFVALPFTDAATAKISEG